MTQPDTAKLANARASAPKRDEGATGMLVRTEPVASTRSIGRVPAPFLTQLIVDLTGAGRASRPDRARRAAGLYRAAARKGA